MKDAPVQLRAVFEEKIWGSTRLAPWFPPPAVKVGEVSFLLPDGSTPPLLVKFLFTSEKLSVQVHPGDDYALAHEGCPGKDEMWLVLAAEPGAQLAAGFREPVTRERARRAALDGEIEQLLQWWPVAGGQVYFVPAGPVHTLGAGLTVCEIQRPSPVTYRFYDYGRGRELHLDRALDVARLDRYPGPSAAEGPLLASCPGFTVESHLVTDTLFQPGALGFQLLVVLEGSGTLAGEPMAPGQVWRVPPGGAPFPIRADGQARLLAARTAGNATP